jgi:hypothetical protein
MQNYHPLTQRNEVSNSSKCEAVSSKLDDSNPESKMLVLESLKQKLLRINGPVTTSVLKAANISKQSQTTTKTLGLSEEELVFLTKTLQEFASKNVKVESSAPLTARPKTPVPLTMPSNAQGESI